MTIQTKEPTYTPCHRFVAMLLLLSMMVQSCGTGGLGMKDGDLPKEEPGLLQGRIASPLPNEALPASAQAAPPATIASAGGAYMTSPTQPTSSGGKEERTTKTNVKRRSGDVDSLDEQEWVPKKTKRDSLADKAERGTRAMTDKEADKYYTDAAIFFHKINELRALYTLAETTRMSELIDDLKQGRSKFRHLCNAYNNAYALYTNGGHTSRITDWRANWELRRIENEHVRDPLISLVFYILMDYWNINPFGKDLLFFANGCIREGGHSINGDYAYIGNYDNNNFCRLLSDIPYNKYQQSAISPLEVISWICKNDSELDLNYSFQGYYLNEEEKSDTPLHIIVYSLQGKIRPDLIDVLLKHNADPTIKNSESNTPLELMRKEATKGDRVSRADSLSIRLLEDATIKHYTKIIKEYIRLPEGPLSLVLSYWGDPLAEEEQ